MPGKTTEALFSFIRQSPTAFHAADQMARKLGEHGFIELQESEDWSLKKGGNYFVRRGGSSLIAFSLGKRGRMDGFQIAAVHGDSPGFKVKERPELEVRGKYLQLNTEGYGGMIASSWMDRPLSLAGRVIVKTSEGLTSRLVCFDRDLVLIPNMAIHMNRKVNEGVPLNKQIDLLPLFGGAPGEKGLLSKLLSRRLSVRPEDIYGSDLYLYNRMEPTVWGAEEEFISAPRLDDLQCAFAACEGFVKESEQNTDNINVLCCFDHEEVGSGTKQGAGSAFLTDVLKRMVMELGESKLQYHRMAAGSFLLSADNAHAVHPAHPEKTDALNCVYMNEGVVIKSNAAQKYTSDAVGVALCRRLCEKGDVPMQFFANRSDEAGGSTLGNIVSTGMGIDGVDIGLAQLAMHSAYETAGERDTISMIRLMETFYGLHLEKTRQGMDFS